ncbi:MAG TPA: hypothetical protein VLE89_01780 [Chlamydiales bacterium]|nr:hypothetical protein [Chlamydiales bacterium]
MSVTPSLSSSHNSLESSYAAAVEASLSDSTPASSTFSARRLSLPLARVSPCSPPIIHSSRTTTSSKRSSYSSLTYPHGPRARRSQDHSPPIVFDIPPNIPRPPESPSLLSLFSVSSLPILENSTKILESLIREQKWIEILDFLEENPDLLSEVLHEEFPLFPDLLQGIRLTKDARVSAVYNALLHSSHMGDLMPRELTSLIKTPNPSEDITADDSDILDRTIQFSQTDSFAKIPESTRLSAVRKIFEHHHESIKKAFLSGPDFIDLKKTPRHYQQTIIRDFFKRHAHAYHHPAEAVYPTPALGASVLDKPALSSPALMQ